MGYITNKGFINLPNYKGGNTIDKSIMYRFVISPACDKLVNYFPRFLAPNLITAIGLFCNFLGLYIIVQYIGVNKSTDTPIDDSECRWVHFFAGFMIFIYMMLDNIDGKQARRTKTSSPLGELFDHGCDSFTVGIAPLIVGCSVGINVWQLVIVFMFSSIPFYLAHWEEYFTHHLVLGMLNGPTEAECVIITLCTLTGFVGQAFWFQELPALPEAIKVFIPLEKVLLRDVMFFTMTMISLATTFGSFFAGTKRALAQKMSLTKGFSQLLPFTLFCVLEFTWLAVSPDLYTRFPVLHILSLTFIFSYLVCRCIVQRICSEDFRLFYKPLIVLILCVANSIATHKYGLLLFSEDISLITLFIVSLGFISHFTYTIIQEMCDTLHITAFTVPKEKQKQN
ncbi:CDP-alcohol phosphatidyltransferase [Tieghemostelium lacteum]|uniref:CDP-alcohol phosphatidyltransferase n=1 Tax=Tieghemostelium lacteum TaxID=361077 RepID=A0A151ZHG8_TIELA|nr:CDP-alcohol phosphatidyltransferase [Tieghemostelium lacteum]|eukprot:KYQ93428.1 CDP-alcohol phosphatidyltransferase [Tieghemostelium lacteum]